MLANMNWTQWLLTVVIICVCLFLMLVILLQRGRGGGIASAFGGGGGSGAFGAKTGDVFTWITCIVAGIFVVLAVTANYAFDKSDLPSRTGPAQVQLPPTSEDGKSQLIPVQLGDDGVALPINADQLPAGLNPVTKSITVTPNAVPSPPLANQPAAPGAAEQPAPAATPPPAAANPPAEKPKEEPATP